MQTSQLGVMGTAKLVVAVFIGTFMEYYDFYLAGVVAGTVWPVIFFPQGNPVIALALSLTGYAVAFLTRLLGGYIFGHFGDRIGRRSVLVYTILLAGISTVAIGLIPPYAMIGMLAPILIFAFRLLYGIGVGGEFGGGVSLIIEHLPKSRWRGFFTSTMTAAGGLGITFASFNYFLVSSLLSHEALVSWGWRALFILGGLMLAIGIFIRYRIQETPLFQQVQQARRIRRHPEVEVLKKYWRTVLLMAGVTITITLNSMLTIVFGFSYVGGLATLSKLNAQALVAWWSLSVSLGSVFQAVASLSGGAISDRVGRKLTIIVPLLASAIFVFPLMYILVGSLNPILMMIGAPLWGFVTGLPIGAMPSLTAESFDTEYRYSGIGLSYGLGAGFFTGVVSAVVLPILISVYNGAVGALPAMIGVIVALCAISIVSTCFVKETSKSELRGSAPAP